MSDEPMARRAFLYGLTFAGGALCGGLAIWSAGGRPSGHLGPARDRSFRSPTPTEGVPAAQPSTALALRVLEEEARQIRDAGKALPERLAHLDGVNRICGFLVEANEVIILGHRDAGVPPIHLDDLAVALQNAYGAGPRSEPPGCTIDPRSGVEDPWRIQQVKVFGMPANSRMAARHIEVDYQLKKVSAGVVSLGDGIPSLYELDRAEAPPCRSTKANEHFRQATHRFWFYPLYPEVPRFLRHEGGVLILKPIEVQLLTEKQFLDRTGRRTGAAPPEPVAERFGALITQLLKTGRLPRYVHLRNDFRVIEAAKLMKVAGVSRAHLFYLLEEHHLEAVRTPAFVGGIRREEHGELVCEARVTERPLENGMQIEAQENSIRFSYRLRGGVEARIDLPPDHFAEDQSGVIADLRLRAHTSRPTPRSLSWSLGNRR